MKNFKNNKGFSLVELIIVVAIMAILIGVLAPTYLKYVERSRLSADNDTIDAVRKACETALADPDSNVTADFTITFYSSKKAVCSDTTKAQTEIEKIVKLDDKTKLKSKAYKTATDTAGNEPVVKATFTNGEVTVTVDNVIEQTTSSASVETTGTPTGTPTITP